MSWKTLDEEILHENPWTSFRRRRFETDSGVRGEYFFVQTKGGCSMVIPQLPDGRFVMVNAYRYLTDQQSIEFPAGGIKEDQTPEEAARAELLEEVGYTAGNLKLMHVFSPDNGVCIDPVHAFIATDLEFVGTQRESAEQMETTMYSEREIDEMIKNNKIVDGQVLACWAIYKASKL